MEPIRNYYKGAIDETIEETLKIIKINISFCLLWKAGTNFSHLVKEKKNEKMENIDQLIHSFNPLRPNIHIPILLTDLHTFP